MKTLLAIATIFAVSQAQAFQENYVCYPGPVMNRDEAKVTLTVESEPRSMIFTSYDSNGNVLVGPAHFSRKEIVPGFSQDTEDTDMFPIDGTRVWADAPYLPHARHDTLSISIDHSEPTDRIRSSTLYGQYGCLKK